MNKDKFILQVAGEYLAAKHEPDHPSYAAFCRETVSQFRGLVNSGWVFERTSDVLYSTSLWMFRDMDKKHLRVFSGGSLAIDNPMAEIKFFTGAYGFVYGYELNFMFRAVHDVMGHYTGKHPFETFEGEVAAYEEHKKWYSPDSLPALYSETIGQLCVFYHTGEFVQNQENKIIEVRL